jgi:hypothetical protein
MSKAANVGSFIIISFLLAALTVFLLRKFEPVRKTSCVTGKIVKISGNSIEILSESGGKARIFSKLENIAIYRNILKEFRRKDVLIGVYFSETYYPFSKKTEWMIDAVSLDFGPAKQK